MCNININNIILIILIIMYEMCNILLLTNINIMIIFNSINNVCENDNMYY